MSDVGDQATKRKARGVSLDLAVGGDDKEDAGAETAVEDVRVC